MSVLQGDGEMFRCNTPGRLLLCTVLCCWVAGQVFVGVMDAAGLLTEHYEFGELLESDDPNHAHDHACVWKLAQGQNHRSWSHSDDTAAGAVPDSSMMHDGPLLIHTNTTGRSISHVLQDVVTCPLTHTPPSWLLAEHPQHAASRDTAGQQQDDVAPQDAGQQILHSSDSGAVASHSAIAADALVGRAAQPIDGAVAAEGAAGELHITVLELAGQHAAEVEPKVSTDASTDASAGAQELHALAGDQAGLPAAHLAHDVSSLPAEAVMLEPLAGVPAMIAAQPAGNTSSLAAGSAAATGKQEPDMVVPVRTTTCEQPPPWQPKQPASTASDGSCAAGQPSTLDAATPAHEQQHWQLQQHQCLQMAAGSVDAGPGVLLGGFLTPRMLLDAYQRTGPGLTVVYVLVAVATGLVIRAALDAVARHVKKRRPLAALPQNLQRNPAAAEAFFKLRSLCFQETAWWRLVGVSGVAVVQAARAERRVDSIVSKNEGAARFARHLLCSQKQRLLADKAAAVAAALADQQQQLEQRHQSDLQQQRTQSEAEAAASAAVHTEEVQGLQSQLQTVEQEKQTLLSENRQQADRNLALQADKAQLNSELRSKGDKLAAQQARLDDMGQQLTEVKQAKSATQQQLAQVQQQVAKEQGRKEALEAKVQEALKREQVLLNKNEGLQLQLSEAQGSISLLRAEGQHKDEALAKQAATNEQLQARSTSLQQQMQQVQTDLAAATQQLSGANSKVAEQQQLLQQYDLRQQELQEQLATAHSLQKQDLIKLEHVLQTQEAAEQSVQRERAEKHAAAAKADELQTRLTSATDQLAVLRAEHVAATAVLQRTQDDLEGLRLQHAAEQESLGDRATEVAALRKQVSELQVQLSVTQEELQQLQLARDEVQQQVTQQQAAAAMREEDLEMLIEECQQKSLQLTDTQHQLQNVRTERDQGRERCAALEEQLADRDQLAEDLAAEQQRHADAKATAAELKARLSAKSDALNHAQQALSELTGQYTEEDLKNRQLGAENIGLQRQVLNLTEHKAQLEEELEEVSTHLNRLMDEHEALLAGHTLLLSESDSQLTMLAKDLAEAVSRSSLLEERLSTAEADVAALTRERDELSKKLYFAEFARDQTKAAKELAADQMIKARQELIEEKVRNAQTPTRTMSMPGARGGVAAAAVGGAAAAAGGGDDVSSSRPWQRTSSQPAKKWASVEPAYLHQHFKDKEGNIRRCDSPSQSSSNNGSTPGTPRSAITSTAGDSSTPGMRSPLQAAVHNAAAAAAGAADSPNVVPAAAGSACRPSSCLSDSSRHSSIAAAAAAIGGRLRRRLSSGANSSSGSSRLQEGFSQLSCDEEQQVPQQRRMSVLRRSHSCGAVAVSNGTGSVEGGPAGSSSAVSSPGHAVAAAAEGLRRNFSDAAGTVSSSVAAAAAAVVAELADTDTGASAPSASQPAVPAGAAGGAAAAAAAAEASAVDGAGCNHSSSSSEQQQQGDASPGSVATGMPPLEATVSTSVCSSRSRTSGPDMRDLRPLALSPVQQSSDLVLTGAEADSPSLSFTSRPEAPVHTGAPTAAPAPAAALKHDADAGDAAHPEVDAALEAAAAAACGGVDGPGMIAAQTSLASVLSGPNTPVASGGAAAALSLECGVEDLQFFTPLPATHTRRSSSGGGGSPAAAEGCLAAAADAASGAVAASRTAGSEDGSLPTTPYFTPQLAPAVDRAVAEPADAAAAAESAVEAMADSTGAPGHLAGTGPAAAAADGPGSSGGAAAVAASECGTGGGVGSSNAWWSRLSAAATSHGSSSAAPSYTLGHMDDADVLIGSLTEADFAAVFAGNTAADVQALHWEQQEQGLLTVRISGAQENMQQPEQKQHMQHEGLAYQQRQQQQQHLGSSADSSSASISSSDLSLVSFAAANATQGSFGAGRAGVPRLPLSQLIAAGAAGGSAAAAAAAALSAMPNGNANAAAAGGGAQLHQGVDSSAAAVAAAADSAAEEPGLCSDDDADGMASSSCSSSGGVVGDADAEDVDAAGEDSRLEDSAVPSDLADTPPKMFIASMPAAAAAATAAGPAAAAAASLGAGPLSSQAMHSPRYDDQRVMHSPRYASQQQQQRVIGVTPQAAEEGVAGSTEPQAAAVESGVPDAGVSAGTDTAPRLGAKAAAGARHKQPGRSPVASPEKAAARDNSPTATTAANGGARHARRSSRLSDPTSSSCSSIKSLVAQSRLQQQQQQQRQQQQQLRRVGSNGSVGAGPDSSVLSVGSPGADQQVLATRTGRQQHRQQRQRSMSAGGSPQQHSIGAAAVAKRTVKQRGSVQALISSTGSGFSSEAGSTGDLDTCAVAAAVTDLPLSIATLAAALGETEGVDTADSVGVVMSSGERSSVQDVGVPPSHDQQQQQQQPQWPPLVPSPAGTCSPVPSTSGLPLVSFHTPPGAHIQPLKAATVGPPCVMPVGSSYSQPRSSVMWKSLDDFVHASRAASVSSSPGVRWAGCVASSMVGLPVSPHMSPAAAAPGVAASAVLTGPYCSPLPPHPAAPALHAGAGMSPSAAAAAAGGGRDGGACSLRLSVGPTAVIPESAAEGDSPDSCSSGGSQHGGSNVPPALASASAVPAADAWVVQENPVYFEHA